MKLKIQWNRWLYKINYNHHYLDVLILTFMGFTKGMCVIIYDSIHQHLREVRTTDGVS